MNRIAIAALVIGIAGLAFAAVAPARAAGSAHEVPDGTLTYKVVITGHGALNNQSGQDASITKSARSIHEVLEATIRLKGAVDSGTVNAKGFTKAKPFGAAKSMGFAQKMQACHGNEACMLKLAKRLSAKENGGAMVSFQSQVGALQLWIQQPMTACTAKVAIANRAAMSGKSGRAGAWTARSWIRRSRSRDPITRSIRRRRCMTALVARLMRTTKTATPERLSMGRERKSSPTRALATTSFICPSSPSSQHGKPTTI